MRDYDSPLTGNDNSKPIERMSYGSDQTKYMAGEVQAASEKPLQELVSRQRNANIEYSNLLQELENKLDSIFGHHGTDPESEKTPPEPDCIMAQYDWGLRYYSVLNIKLHKQLERLRKLI